MKEEELTVYYERGGGFTFMRVMGWVDLGPVVKSLLDTGIEKVIITRGLTLREWTDERRKTENGGI